MKFSHLALLAVLAMSVSPAAVLGQDQDVNELIQETEMSVTHTENLEMAKAFFTGLEQRDLSVVEPLLAPHVLEVIPLSNTGAPEPWRTFDGKQAVLDYLGEIIKNFSRTVLVDKQFTVSHDGSVVFLEAKGDLTHAATGKSYNNVYVFKFTFAGGQIVHISEYGNPVPYAKLAGAPLG
jgi:ketosteroid isomerase-like protein